MEIDNKLINLAVDSYFGRLGKEYSVADSQEVLRKALLEANNGKSTIDLKAIRDGKCSNLFSIIEVVVEKVSEEGLKGDEFFTNFIENRNLALGDSNIFHTKKDVLLTVTDVAEGTQGIRRQRFESGQDITINTQLRAIKVYEELNRVLAGRVDFNDLIKATSTAFTRYDLDSAYAAFGGMINGLQAPYMQTGTLDADKLLDLVEHVEASTGESATIIGTRKALRKIPDIDGSDSHKESIYSMGYAGKLAGVPLIAMKQRHEIGGTKFILPDDTLYVFAGGTKPIKRVTEGSVTMLQGDLMGNQDMSQEFLMLKRTGVGVVMDRDYGAYKFSNV